MQHQHEHSFLSALRRLAANPAKERIFVSDVLALMQDRAIVVLILLFALPNVVPVPPGTSAVLGAPLLFLTAQWALGMQPWLPRMVVRSSMARSDVERLLDRIGPWVSRADRLLKPRLAPLGSPVAERLVAVLCIVLSLILFLPIPFGNMLPAFSISVMALGFLRRDGLWILVGIVATLASMAIGWHVGRTVIRFGVDLLQRLLP